MRLLYQELRRVVYQRFWLLCLAGAVILGALFPCTSLYNLDHVVVQLFGTPGIMYGLLLVMAMIVVPLGTDFSQRTFQQKIAQGNRRLSLTVVSFSISMLGAGGAALTFPISTILFTRIYCGLGTNQEQNFTYLLGDIRFYACLLAYTVGLLAAGSLCFLITSLCRDLVKSIGFSTGYIILSVMLSQKAIDLNTLDFLRPVFEWTPIYQLLINLRDVTISLSSFHILLLTSCVLIFVAVGVSFLVLRHAKLK